MDTTVAIFDLRSNDAWDVDFCLVRHSLVTSPYMDDVMYFDRCGDPIYFSGSFPEAITYYTTYCVKHGLKLVEYHEMEGNELISRKLHRNYTDRGVK